MRGLRSVLFLVLCVGCLEPYAPPVSSDSLKALVVDGYVDVNGTAMVKLSRSIPLNSNSFFPAERGATVTIESSNGEIYSLTEGDSAVYTASDLNVSMNDTYTLRILTTNGKEYTSDHVQIYPTPVVDNVYFGVGPTGEQIEVYVDAHDDNPDATGFYLWDSSETYEYHAPFYIGWKLVGGVPYEREPGELMYTCWRTDVIPSVVLSTHYLSDNTISKKRISVIDKGSLQLEVRYSILVSQRMISEEEYVFRTQLQKSTEELGSLFAVIPGAVVSNIHSITDPGEYVLGYFRGQQVQERRLFIDNADLPKAFQFPHSQAGCQTEVSCSVDPALGGAQQFNCIDVHTIGSNTLIVSANTNGAGVVKSFNVVSAACGDCRYKGGTLTRPSFW